jgi:hypothetical protein
MTAMPRTRPTRLATLACCLGLLTAPVALAQGGGSGGGASGGTAGTGGPSATPGGMPGASQPNTSVLGSGATGGTGQAGGAGGQGGQPGQRATSPGPSGPDRRAQTESKLRESGVAPPPNQDEQQLRDLNALSRQLTPGTPVPAPQVQGGPTGR